MFDQLPTKPETAPAKRRGRPRKVVTALLPPPEGERVKPRDEQDYPHIPKETDFDGAEFLADEKLTKLAKEVFNEEAQWMKDVPHAILWKLKGGNKGTKAVLGRCEKISGLAKWCMPDTQVVIWAAADHLRTMRPTWKQMKALLYHESLHVVKDAESGKFVLIGHDFEGFRMEIERFGFWRNDLTAAAETFKHQLNLFPEGKVEEKATAENGDQ